MKKLIGFLVVGCLLALATSAMATPWETSVANGVQLNGGHPNYTFLYDLTGSGDPLNVLTDPSNPFNPGLDVISSTNLFLNFSFEGASAKSANIKLDVDKQTLTAFTIADVDFILNADVIALLNSNGTLQLDIQRTAGTFSLTNSILTAYGTDNTSTTAPVPEPSTLLLLGAGLVGLAYAKRRRKE